MKCALTIGLAGWLISSVASRAENTVTATNDAASVEAMSVSEEKKPSKAAEAVEAAQTTQLVALEKKQKQKNNKDPWQRFYPPTDTKYDWVQLSSGEWLKGEFKVLYDFLLEFDSDELDLQEFDFDDVSRMRTRSMKTVLVEQDDRSTKELRGVLEIDGDAIILRRGEHEVIVPRAKVIAIADGKQKERNNWSGMVSVGVNVRGGNTETTDTTVMLNVKRRTAKSRFNSDYLANYSHNGDKETANNQRLSGYFDRFLTTRFYWQLLAGEYYRDPFTNIDGQYSLGTGLGYDVVRSAKTEWTLTAGVGYQDKRFVSVEADKDKNSSSPFAALGTKFDHEVSGNVDFYYTYNLKWLNRENGQYTHHMLAKLSFDLFKDLDLDVSAIWDRIERPQKDEDGNTPKQDDYQLIVSLTYDF